SLAPGGWLMLGPSDPMPADRGLLERVDVPDGVLWRRRGAVAEQPLVIAARPKQAPVSVRKWTAPTPAPVLAGDGQAELEAGLLALEAGSACSALEWLRRATFRDPHDPVAQ